MSPKPRQELETPRGYFCTDAHVLRAHIKAFFCPSGRNVLRGKLGQRWRKKGLEHLSEVSKFEVQLRVGWRCKQAHRLVGGIEWPSYIR